MTDRSRPKWKLINNFSHTVLEFRTRRELLDWAKEHGWKVKRSNSLFCSRCYYIEDYTILPTGFKD